MEDIGRKTWYDGSMKKGKDPRGGLRRVFYYSLDCCVFTGLDAERTPFGDPIFLCLKKDWGERQTKGTAVPVGSPG